VKVVSNASPLVNLARIGQLALLQQLFGRLLLSSLIF
jgi:predicted nucleic acid-binding protein